MSRCVDKHGEGINEGDVVFRNATAGIKKSVIIDDCIVEGRTVKGDIWDRKYRIIMDLGIGWFYVQSIYPHKDRGIIKTNWESFERVK